MLFHVVNDRHQRRRSMIFTTNKPLEAWGDVLHDEDLAHAIVKAIGVSVSDGVVVVQTSGGRIVEYKNGSYQRSY